MANDARTCCCLRTARNRTERKHRCLEKGKFHFTIAIRTRIGLRRMKTYLVWSCSCGSPIPATNRRTWWRRKKGDFQKVLSRRNQQRRKKESTRRNLKVTKRRECQRERERRKTGQLLSLNALRVILVSAFQGKVFFADHAFCPAWKSVTIFPRAMTTDEEGNAFPGIHIPSIVLTVFVHWHADRLL